VAAGASSPGLSLGVVCWARKHIVVVARELELVDRWFLGANEIEWEHGPGCRWTNCVQVGRHHVRPYVKPASVSYHTNLRISDQTGRTDIPFTERGQEQIKSKASFLVGEGSTSKWLVGGVH
jgi:hypothetical protein